METTTRRAAFPAGPARNEIERLFTVQPVMLAGDASRLDVPYNRFDLICHAIRFTSSHGLQRGQFMRKRTKIVATLGPACDSDEKVTELAEAGVDLFRINFSHGSESQREHAIRQVRQAESRTGRPLAICGDLCGPKIRVGLIEAGEVKLETGQQIVVQREAVEGNAQRISTTLPELIDLVQPGESILLADGRLRLEVLTTHPPDQFVCRVLVGGVLRSGKGVNLPQTQLKISALTEKDRQDAAWIAGKDFDFVALSFVQKTEDVQQLRDLLKKHGSEARIIAKIEKPQAIQQIDSIIDAADAIMVARGDLGVEMDFPSVPVTQKSIAHKCERAAKPCIIATEMLESMISSPRPTRAEVSDVANAVFDRVDAVMLSAESAIGQYPVAAVSAMQRTIQAAESYEVAHAPRVHLKLNDFSTAGALASAVNEIMSIDSIAAIAVFTASGNTARLISKNRPTCPIVAISSNLRTLRQCCLYHGVLPTSAETPRDTIEAIHRAAQICQEKALAEAGQRVIVLAGHPFDVPGNTNGLMVVTVGE